MSKTPRTPVAPPLIVPPPPPLVPPAGAVWNNVRRVWAFNGVALDPQPPPPAPVLESAPTRGSAPPSVKVLA